MSYWPILMMVLVLAGGYGFRFWMMRRVKGSFRSPEGQQALVQFFESTGYRQQERLHAGPAEQAELWARTYDEILAQSQRATQAAQLSYRMVMRREFDDMGILWTSGYEGGTALNQWQIVLPTPARIRWRAVTRATAGWSPRDMHEIASGDPEIDKAIAVFGQDEAGVRQALAAPGVKDALLSLTHVDLSVDGSIVSFDDSMSKNQQAAMGGYVGMVLAAGNLAPSLGMSTPIHDHVADLMTRAARASA